MNEYVRVTTSPKKGDKRTVRERVKAGESLTVYCYNNTGRDYTFTFKVAGEVDVVEEYYTTSWLRMDVLVDTFTPDEPEPSPDLQPQLSDWERLKQWLMYPVKPTNLPVAKIVEDK